MKTADLIAGLKRLNIHNPHNLLSRFGDREKDVAVVFIAAQPRFIRASGTRVFSPFFDTDPQAAWYDYKQKSFVGNMAESLPAAKAWAEEQYGITEWSLYPGERGMYVPKRVLDLAKAEVARA